MTFIESTSPFNTLVNTPRDPAFLIKKVETYYRDRLNNTWNGVHPMKGKAPGPSDIQVRTNDYLCLASDPRVIAAEVNHLEVHGHGESVSRIWLHHQNDILHQFEDRVANLLEAEAAVLCNSGYCANVGLIQSIVEPGSPVFIDMKAHASLWEGIKSAGARAIPVRHNDAEHLSRQIKKEGQGVIVVDAVYSIDGDVCPLREFVEVCERHGCAIIVDETHSFGTQGRYGAGLTVALGLADRVHFRTIGLSKAVPCRGGLVICSQRNAEFLRYESLPAIFSTTVLGHEVAAYNKVLDIFASEPWRRSKLHSNHRRIHAALDQLGYNVQVSRSQIIALEAGSILTTVKLRDALERRGLFGALFFPPATPEKRCLIRFTVNCGLSPDDINRIISICADVRTEVGMEQWPSTRRKHKENSRSNLGAVAA